jgi:hypothetical protein
MTRLYFLSAGPEEAVRYIGKTTKSLGIRLMSHLCDAHKGTKNHRCTWLRSLSGPPHIELIAEVPGDGSAEEIALIAGLRLLGIPLVNGTAGGEGTVGYRHSPEIRSKISAALTPERREKIAAGQRGRTASAALRKKLSKAHLGKRPTDATRAKMSLSQKMRMKDPLVRAIFVASGRQSRAATRQKITSAKRGS